MKKPCILYITLIITMLSRTLSSQAAYDYSEFGFIGRYIEWSNNQYYPWPNPGTQSQEPLSNALGFFDHQFTIPLKYDDHIVQLGWDNDVIEAISAWNSVSNKAKMSASALGHVDIAPQINWPPENVIFVDFIHSNPVLKI